MYVAEQQKHLHQSRLQQCVRIAELVRSRATSRRTATRCRPAACADKHSEEANSARHCSTVYYDSLEGNRLGRNSTTAVCTVVHVHWLMSVACTSLSYRSWSVYCCCTCYSAQQWITTPCRQMGSFVTPAVQRLDLRTSPPSTTRRLVVGFVITQLVLLTL